MWRCSGERCDHLLDGLCRRRARVLDAKDAGDRRQAVADLMAERRELYDVADYSVDTSDLSPLQVVDDIAGYLKREGVFRA